MTLLSAVNHLFLFLIGISIGSFLNVVVYRLPRECMSVARGRSRCPRCAKPIAWFDNLPLLSYLLLWGKGRCCKTPIGLRYPLVELVTGIAFVLLGRFYIGAALEELPWAAPANSERWLEAALASAVVSACIALSLIDLDWRILPNELTFSGIILGPVFAFLAPGLQPGEHPLGLDPNAFGEWTPRVEALGFGLLGILFSAGVLYGVGWLGAKAFRKPAMGLGDVKMIGAMGGLLGTYALLALVVAAVLGSVIGVLVLLKNRSRYIPFGPFLAMGMVIVMLWGEALWNGYRGI